MIKKAVTLAGVVASAWGIIGLLSLLCFAVFRLSLYTFESLQMPLHWMHWCVLFGFTALMAHSEGYKGFQKKFSPRFAARSKYLLSNATPLQLLLAPLFCMSYFHAPKKRVITTCALTIMIVIFIYFFRFIPQPWKGLLDAGVVIGLIWGIIATVIHCFKAFTDNSFYWDAEVQVTP